MKTKNIEKDRTDGYQRRGWRGLVKVLRRYRLPGVRGAGAGEVMHDVMTAADVAVCGVFGVDSKS